MRSYHPSAQPSSAWIADRGRQRSGLFVKLRSPRLSLLRSFQPPITFGPVSLSASDFRLSQLLGLLDKLKPVNVSKIPLLANLFGIDSPLQRKFENINIGWGLSEMPERTWYRAVRQSLLIPSLQLAQVVAFGKIGSKMTSRIFHSVSHSKPIRISRDTGNSWPSFVTLHLVSRNSSCATRTC